MSTKRKYLHKKRRKKKNVQIRKKISLKIKQKRDQFTLTNGQSIVWLKNKILKMQSELAVALRERNISHVTRLINKVIRSDLAQQYAVYKTISFKGARSKGILDKVRPLKTSQYLEIKNFLWETIKKPKKYRASPLKRIWIPKSNSEELRPLSVPGYNDRALQHLYLIVLDVIAEEFADSFSFGFRPFRSPGWAAKALTLQVWSRKSFGPPQYALELDIRKCFDSISHDFIVDLLSKYKINEEFIQIINPFIITQWLKCGYIDFNGIKTPKNQKIATTSGIPQGGPISPTIANMVLDGIEEVILNSRIPIPENINNIDENDQVIWLHEGKEVICSINTSIEETVIINKSLRDLGYDPPKSMARQFYNGSWIHNRGPWSYKIVNKDSNYYKIKAQIKLSYISCIRYADDITILFNNLEYQGIILNNINNFLNPRGLEINNKKTILKKLLEGDKILFVGYEFSLIKKNGVWKVYNYPPKTKIQNVKDKIKKIFIENKYNPYIAFYKANAVLRGWTNFYRTANSKESFQKLTEWLFKRTYSYLTDYLKNDPKYRTKSQRFNKKHLCYDLWKEFRFPTSQILITKWFGIPQSLNPNIRWSKIDLKPYMLLNPKFVEVSTPTIITNKSAYFPSERYILQEKAIYWKAGFIKDLLIKSKGSCKSCGCSLLDNNSNYEVHHIEPIDFKGKQKFTNLALLCIECHAGVTKAVKSKNIEQILLYEQNKILNNVSDFFIFEKDTIS